MWIFKYCRKLIEELKTKDKILIMSKMFFNEEIKDSQLFVLFIKFVVFLFLVNKLHKNDFININSES